MNLLEGQGDVVHVFARAEQQVVFEPDALLADQIAVRTV